MKAFCLMILALVAAATPALAQQVPTAAQNTRGLMVDVIPVATVAADGTMAPGSTAALQATANTALAQIATSTAAAAASLAAVDPNATATVQAYSQYPVGAVPITASATGTTAATTATLAGTSGKTTYICGFSIRANATAAATGTATITGTVTGTLSFVQWTAPLATGIGEVRADMSGMCVPASAVNTGIAVVSAAPGTGGTVSVSAWGFQL